MRIMKQVYNLTVYCLNLKTEIDPYPKVPLATHMVQHEFLPIPVEETQGEEGGIRTGSRS